MHPKKFLYDANDGSLYMVHRDLKQLDDCVEAAHNSELNRFSFNKLECNWAKTQRILLILSYNREYQSVKLLRFNIDNKFDWKIRVNVVYKTISRVSYLLCVEVEEVCCA